MYTTQQTWFHLEDNIRKSASRRVREVIDIQTSDPNFEVNLPQKFAELKVIARNTNKELSYIQKGQKAIINLGPLEDWPVVNSLPPQSPNLSNSSNLIRQIRLELIYTHTNPKFNPTFLTGYEAKMKFPNYLQPEIALTIPKGMELKKDNGEYIKLKLYKTNNQSKKLKFEDKSFRRENNGKYTYTFIIDEDSYKKIKNAPKGIVLYFSYKVKNRNNFLFFILFAFFGLALPIIILTIKLSLLYLNLTSIGWINNTIGTVLQPSSFDSKVFEGIISLQFMVVIIAFITSFFGLSINSQFEIPFRKWIYSLIGISLALFIILFYLKYFLIR